MSSIGQETADAVVALREKWHTKNHPFYVEFADGKVPLKALGKMMVQHYQHTSRAVPSFGLAFYKAPPEAKQAFLDNLAEEEGITAGDTEGRQAVNHLDIIIAFCERAGVSREEVLTAEQLPSWRARTYNYINTLRDEQIPVIVAFQSTQEGQQPAINAERTIPGLIEHHGFKLGTPEIMFFEEHEMADAEHSQRQVDLVAQMIKTEEMSARALELAEIAVKIRWAGMTEVYRKEVLGQHDPLPEGIAA